MHMASVEVHGEGSSTSCYDSVVKYLILKLEGALCREKCVPNQENGEEMPNLA